MSEGEIRWVGDLQRLEIKPGDRFVLQIDRPVSCELADRIKKAWSDFVGDRADVSNLLILDASMKLGAISTEATA